MAMELRVFKIPEGLETEMIEFYASQDTYPLIEIKKGKGISAELGKHLGAYVLFYKGSFELYASIVAANQDAFEVPIYVGKAVPKGDRTGKKAEKVIQENSLRKRLREHLRSIDQAENLSADDFYFRVIPTELHTAAWVESVLIGHLRPAWNTHISGFGNHDPGKGRYDQERSIWDQIHPGRPWTLKLTNLAAFDLEDIRRKISESHRREEAELEIAIEEETKAE